jgi:hypothetical protein
MNDPNRTRPRPIGIAGRHQPVRARGWRVDDRPVVPALDGQDLQNCASGPIRRKQPSKSPTIRRGNFAAAQCAENEQEMKGCLAFSQPRKRLSLVFATAAWNCYAGALSEGREPVVCWRGALLAAPVLARVATLGNWRDGCWMGRQ